MTKREIIQEIIEGVNYPNNTRVIDRCIKSDKSWIECVYEYYQHSNKTIEDKLFCINILSK